MNEKYWFKARLIHVLPILLCLFFTGCPEDESTRRSTINSNSAVNSDSPNPAGAAGSNSNGSSVLAEKFYADSDGNAIPDFIETELGFNPQADDCPYRDCGLGASGEELDLREQNTLLILDSSGSMRAQNKMAAAKKALLRYVQTISAVQNLGLMVYGHRGNNSESGRQESCQGIDLLAPVGEVRRENFQSVLAQFEPTGWTPIAGALTKANEALTGREQQNNRIILVSDGIETCGGDPVVIAKKLHEAGFRMRIDVVGFDVGKSDAEQLRKIAEITGGEYFDAKTGADLDEYLKKQTAAIYETRAAIGCEIGNLMHTPLCDQQLVNKALFYLMEQRDEAFKRQQLNQRDGDKESAEKEKQTAAAYKDLMNRISAAKDEREKKSREAVPRFRELERKMNVLGRQIREVYGQ